MRNKTGLVHQGVHRHRTEVDDPVGQREAVFARAWEEGNINKQYGGWFPTSYCSLLESLMVKDGKAIPVTQETATAVATVFQWLATPVGFAFLNETLKEAGYHIARTDEDKK